LQKTIALDTKLSSYWLLISCFTLSPPPFLEHLFLLLFRYSMLWLISSLIYSGNFIRMHSEGKD